MEFVLLFVLTVASAFAVISSVVLLVGGEDTPQGRLVSGVFSILVLILFVVHLITP